MFKPDIQPELFSFQNQLLNDEPGKMLEKQVSIYWKILRIKKTPDSNMLQSFENKVAIIRKEVLSKQTKN